eukprot:365251-Chlamydomonas_euryale.AAC.12
MDGWMDGWINGWMDGRMDKWMDKRVDSPNDGWPNKRINGVNVWWGGRAPLPLHEKQEGAQQHHVRCSAWAGSHEHGRGSHEN